MRQQRQIAFLRNFLGAERGQMRRGKLAIEQFRPAPAQRRDQPGQRHFRGIWRARKHAFAAEHPGKTYAIKPADQPFGAVGPGHPRLDRMRRTQRVQLAIAFADARADPAFRRIGARRGAMVDHRIECAVAGHPVPPAAQRARQRARQVKAVERQDRAHARFDPIDFGIIAAVGHGKDPGAIGPQQQLGGNDLWFFARHGLLAN